MRDCCDSIPVTSEFCMAMRWSRRLTSGSTTADNADTPPSLALPWGNYSGCVAMPLTNGSIRGSRRTRRSEVAAYRTPASSVLPVWGRRNGSTPTPAGRRTNGPTRSPTNTSFVTPGGEAGSRKGRRGKQAKATRLARGISDPASNASASSVTPRELRHPPLTTGA